MPRRLPILAIVLFLLQTVPLSADAPTRDSGRQVADVDLDAVKAIENVGGWVIRDEQGEGRPVIGIDLQEMRLSKELLKAVTSCKQVQTLDLRGRPNSWGQEKATDEVLKELATCRELRSLNLGWCHDFTNKGLKELAACRELQSLDLSECRGVDEASLKEIGRFRQLRSLTLSRTWLHTEELKELAAAHPQLRSLTLHNCVLDKGVKELVACKQLEALEISKCSLTDAEIKALAACEQLKWVNLSETKVSDEGDHCAGPSGSKCGRWSSPIVRPSRTRV